PRRVLAQGRHQRKHPTGAVGGTGLRRRHAAGAGRPGRPRLPPRHHHLLRRRRPRRRHRRDHGVRPMSMNPAPGADGPTGAPAAQAYPELVGGIEGDSLGLAQPDRETFRALAAHQRVVPVSMRLLADEDTPVSLYRRLTDGLDARGTVLLESAGEGEDSRWSIIGARARAVLTERDGRAHWIGD